MAQQTAAPPPLPTNRGPYAARLALKLVEEALGPLCRAVLKCLLDHGMQQVVLGVLARSHLAAGAERTLLFAPRGIRPVPSQRS